jgi:hypothetical protein
LPMPVEPVLPNVVAGLAKRPDEVSRDAATRASESLIAAKGKEPATTPSPPTSGPSISEPAAPTGPNVFTTVDEDHARQQLQLPRKWLAVLAPLVALVLAIAGLWTLVVYLTRPYSADELYEKVAALADRDDANSIRTVEREISEFIARFPKDARAAELRNSQERVKLARTSRRLQLQAQWGGLSDPSLLPVEALYLRAMNLAQSSPSAAIAMLESLVKLYEPESTADAEPSEAATSGGGKQDDAVERRARCIQMAKQQLKTLHDEKQVSRQLAVIRERLATAAQLSESDPRRANDMYLAIVELYSKDSWAEHVVAEARQQIDKLAAAVKTQGELETRRQGAE